MPGIIVDIGTGDGRFAYALAKEHPDRLIIGIDPHRKGMEEMSLKAAKKPARGGLSNALFVLADVEQLPDELNGLANQVFINFPWGSLLKGVVLVEPDVWASIKRICQPGAQIDLVFGYDPEAEAGAISALGLPPLDQGYIEDTMAPKLAAAGFRVESVEEITADDLKEFPSTWAKKLAFGQERTYFHVTCVAP